jgi:hypothetical protein
MGGRDERPGPRGNKLKRKPPKVSHFFEILSMTANNWPNKVMVGMWLANGW